MPTDQEWPEIAWPAIGRVPIPWIVSPEQKQDWIERHASGAGDYHWFLEARPLTDDIESVTAMSTFGTGHEFDELCSGPVLERPAAVRPHPPPRRMFGKQTRQARRRTARHPDDDGHVTTPEPGSSPATAFDPLTRA